MAVFSEETRALLQQAGWSEDRYVDTSEYEKSLKSEGYPLHEVVLDFLKHFGGLRVVHPHHRVKDEKDEFYINPTVAVADIGSGWVKEYSERVGAPLCVIGEAFSYHMTLVMDSDGRVFAGYDDTLIHVGNSGTDAIEALCSGREMPEVP
ncbi:MAG: SUKH-3 domain-containing protein [Chlorogloeopsis fritschii C42_A2020_084]|uniref:SUKH-3 domain-containing protein n=1 Tax=Chlorogloeopsis fritschii TaxID=1124 RepID=UPI001A0B1A47|nr:SUKH-3 domain-containing protein [Chlorogloeopsis fritschii]MBF2005505.1 SUKH-3 domain-containing protein [Chlorogloeopsis fritschii C42_A2020_084]